MLTRPPLGTATPLGATVTPQGTTFRVWAPRAHAVFLRGKFNNWQIHPDWQLFPLGDETWGGFAAGFGDGEQFKYWVVGPAGEWWKRDPRARLLTTNPKFPGCNCIVRDPKRFPWHDTGYRTPAFNNLVLYQMHVGTFFMGSGSFGGEFMDVAAKLPYLRSLGVNGLQLMPVVEFPTEFSLGYNGTDYFSPENDYGQDDPAVLQQSLNLLNGLLAAKGQAPYPNVAAISGCDNQLRALVDLCHVYGIAVLFDVVYNHAGGGFDDSSLFFFDMMWRDNSNNSLYFTDQGWAGGLVFAYWNNHVKQFLIDNAKLMIEEYRVDGLRFDEASVMNRYGGWGACQDIVATCRFIKPEALHVAEYWPVNPAVVRRISEGGAGFDATWHDGLRNAVRRAVGQASGGANAYVDMDGIASAIATNDLGARWRAVQCVEDHDIVKMDRDPRVPRLADPSNPRSWYARSRSRVAAGLVLTAPGIPMIFMGQEFLEDKPFSDNANSGSPIWWEGLNRGDKSMVDHLRFTSELIQLRWNQPALRSEGTRVHHAHNLNRVLAFHRWIEGYGRDVVVVASLNESTLWGYRIGFPSPGQWLEVFNSDIYDNWVNPIAAGNGGSVFADSSPLHDMPASASIVIPANSVVVFARDSGD